MWETVWMPRKWKPASMWLTNACLVTLFPAASGNRGEYSGPPKCSLAQIACSLMAQAGQATEATTALAPLALGHAHV